MKRLVVITLGMFALALGALTAQEKKGYVVEGDGKDLSFVYASLEKSVKRTFPQAEPAKDARVPNYARFPGDGNCMWVSIDTALKAGEWNYSLNKYCKGGTNGDEAYYALQQAKIPTVYKRPFSGRNYKILEKACEEGCPCVVTLDRHRHAINLVGITEDKVALIDNNDRGLPTKSVSRRTFDNMWDGGVLVPLPKNYEGDLLNLVKQCAPGSPNCSPQAFNQPYPRLPAADDTGKFQETGSFRTVKGDVPIYDPTEAERKAFWKAMGNTDEEIKAKLADKGIDGLTKQDISFIMANPTAVKVGDQTPGGKVVKVELIGNKRVITLKEELPEETVVIQQRAAQVPAPQFIQQVQVPVVPAFIGVSPAVLRDTPRVARISHSGLFGLRETVEWDDGVVVERGPVIGKRVYYPR